MSSMQLSGIGANVTEVVDNSSIPTINLTGIPLSASSGSCNETVEALLVENARQIDASCSEYGFAYIYNPPIDWKIVENGFLAAKEYFDLPQSIKDSMVVQPYSAHGYLGFDTQHLNVSRGADLKENFNVARPLSITNMANNVPCPEHLSHLPQAVNAFVDQAHQLSKLMLQLYSLAVGQPKNWLMEKHQAPANESPANVFRMMRYPAIGSVDENGQTIKPAPNQLRCGEHTDFGTVTMLFQSPDDVGSGGLQLFDLKKNVWISMPYRPNCIAINTGDCLKRWTNDRYISNTHRVVLPDDANTKPRYSFPYFVIPSHETVVEVIPRYVNGVLAESKYVPIKAKDYLLLRRTETAAYAQQLKKSAA